jgi:hypothetical protein
MEKSLDLVHASWTTASDPSTVHPHGGAEGKPLESGWDGALACQCSPAAAGEGRGSVGDSPWGSLELGERQSCRATQVKWQRWWGSMGVCSDVGEEERGAVIGAGCSRAEVPFYRGRGRALGDDNGRHWRRNGRRREW